MGIIKKQSLQSTIIIYVGFLIGAFNVMYLFPKCFTGEQYGLTIALFAASSTIASLSSLGVNRIMIRFYPFYHSHLKRGTNDFLTLSFLVPIIGFVFFTVLTLLFREQLFAIYSKKSALFVDYFYYLFPGALALLLFSIVETYTQNLLKSVFANVMRELGYRIFILFAIILYIFHFVDFRMFMILFTSYYFLATLVMLGYIYKIGHLHFSYTISKLSRRMKMRMIKYGAFMFGGGVIGILADNLDKILIAGISGLENTAVFTIAAYIATILRVPQRGMTGIITPIISKAWRDKRPDLIDKIYKGSSINLMIASCFIFLLIWINIDLLYSFLPAVYANGKWVVLIMSLSVIIDLSMGANAEILFTSSSWKVFFYTHILLLALSIPTNYFLIKHFGIIGSAYSNLIAFTGYNVYRYIFIKRKYGLDPFSWNTLKCFIICIGSYFLVVQLNFFTHPFVAAFFKSFTLGTLMFCALLYFRISEDFNHAVTRFTQRFIKRA